LRIEDKGEFRREDNFFASTQKGQRKEDHDANIWALADCAEKSSWLAAKPPLMANHAMRLVALTAIVAVGWCAASAAQTSEAEAFATFRKLQPQCALPAVPEDHELILIGAAEPQTATNLIFSGARKEAELVTVDVEATRKPLTLAIAAQPDLVWEFKGAVAGVERILVLTNENNRTTGLAGIAAERVIFGDVTPCHSVNWHGTISNQAQEPRGWGMFGIFFGRRPDRVIAVNDAIVVKIPSGRIDAQTYGSPGVVFEYRGSLATEKFRLNFGPDGRARVMRGVSGPPVSAEEEEIREFVENYPGGLQKIDPRKIVSPVPVTTSSRLDRFSR
jgi:hypothetical protein